MKTKLAFLVGSIVGSLATAGCDIDVPDLNNPGLDELSENPTPAAINSACTGLFIGQRAAKATTVGWVNLLGILGRESYDFDANDGRFVGEMIQGPLSKSSPFGGSFWGPQYVNIRNANLILGALDKTVPPYSAEGASAIRGFAHTMQAFELLIVIITHNDTGAPIKTDQPVGEPLGPLVPKNDVYTEIHRLLDLAKTELEAAGADSSFPFTIPAGYATFGTPTSFIRFNRAIKARAFSQTAPSNKAQYADMLTALSESFLNDAIPMGATTIPAAQFNVGASWTYSTAAGDATNALTNTNIFAHPSLETDAKPQAANMAMKDARYLAKVTTIDNNATRGAAGDDSLSTKIRFRNLGARTVQGMDLPADSPRLYANTTSIPIIRNEDLILLKAEAQWFTGAQAAAVETLNKVRVGSGRLAPLTQPADDTTFIDELLYDRRYSLMFEGGHRWIDHLRFGRLLPLDSEEHVRNVRFPIPLSECDGRPGEAGCSLTSSAAAP